MPKTKKTVKIGKYILDILPSKSLRLRKMYKGITYTIIFEEKPTEKEVTQALSAEMDKVKAKKTNMTFRTAAEDYIELKRNILSPTTIREYTNTVSRLSNNFVSKRLSDITALDVQKEINDLTKSRSPKTVRNYHGFISAVLRTYRPNLMLHTTLPQKIKNEPYIPTDNDIKMILSEVTGTQYEVPIMLACYGLRRSEICALTPEDLVEDVLTINKAKVLDKNKEWVIKTTKTTESTREVVIPLKLADKIREQGFIYTGHPNTITCHLNDLQDRLGIPRFSIHKLRHYFASKMSALGVPEVDILKMGGWETDYVMKKVYRHSLQEREAKRQASNKLNDALIS